MKVELSIVFLFVLVILLFVMFNEQPANLESYEAVSIPPKTHNKTLVVLFGNMRGGMMAWNSMIKHVLRPLQADLALLTDINKSNEYLNKLATYRWHVEEVSDWGVYLDFYNKSKAWRQTFCIKGRNHNQFGGVIPRCGTGSGSGALGLVFREEMRRRLPEIHDHYEWIVFQRSDFLFECDHVPIDNFHKDIVYVKSTGYRPVTDRAMIVHKATAHKAFNIVPYMFKHDRLWTSKYISGGIENAISNYLTLAKVLFKYYDIPAGIVKTKEDRTRWNNGQHSEELEPFGLLRKYWNSDKDVVKRVCGKPFSTYDEYKKLLKI